MATQSQLKSDTLLRRALRANALFSTASGALFLLASPQVADFLGLDGAAPFIAVAGIGILLFAAFVLYTATRERINPRLALAITGLDVVWVIGSAGLLLSGALSLTTAGRWAVLIVADVVAVFALIEYVGLRRIR